MEFSFRCTPSPTLPRFAYSRVAALSPERTALGIPRRAPSRSALLANARHSSNSSIPIRRYSILNNSNLISLTFIISIIHIHINKNHQKPLPHIPIHHSYTFPISFIYQPTTYISPSTLIPNLFYPSFSTPPSHTSFLHHLYNTISSQPIFIHHNNTHYILSSSNLTTSNASILPSSKSSHHLREREFRQHSLSREAGEGGEGVLVIRPPAALPLPRRAATPRYHGTPRHQRAAPDHRWSAH